MHQKRQSGCLPFAVGQFNNAIGGNGGKFGLAWKSDKKQGQDKDFAGQNKSAVKMQGFMADKMRFMAIGSAGNKVVMDPLFLFFNKMFR